MYTITSDLDVRDMARGAVLLGSGGGGDPYVGELYLRNQLAEGRSPKIVKAAELADDAFVVSIAGVGAPTVIIEHLVSTHTLLRLLEASETFYGRKIDALISAEIGGVNSMFPLALGTRAGIPVRRRRRNGSGISAPGNDDVWCLWMCRPRRVSSWTTRGMSYTCTQQRIASPRTWFARSAPRWVL